MLVKGVFPHFKVVSATQEETSKVLRLLAPEQLRSVIEVNASIPVRSKMLLAIYRLISPV